MINKFKLLSLILHYLTKLYHDWDKSRISEIDTNWTVLKLCTFKPAPLINQSMDDFPKCKCINGGANLSLTFCARLRFMIIPFLVQCCLVKAYQTGCIFNIFPLSLNRIHGCGMQCCTGGFLIKKYIFWFSIKTILSCSN